MTNNLRDVCSGNSKEMTYSLQEKEKKESSKQHPSLPKNENRFLDILLKNGAPAQLHVKRFAKQLHIKPKVVRELADQGYFNDLFSQRARQISRTRETYERIIGYRNTRPAFSAVTSLTLDQLKKVVRAGEALTSRKKEGIFRFNKKNFFLRLSKSDKLKIYEIREQLGQGFYGTAFNAIDLSKDQEKVFKQARPEKGAQAIKDIKNEYEILHNIHATGKVWGIQEEPNALIKVTQGLNFIGYLGKKYDREYFYDSEDTPLDQRLSEFYQLLYALSSLEKKGIIHGDIKTTNIFVKVVNGRKSIYLADFGGACDANRVLSAEKIRPSTYTKYYIPFEDFTSHVQNNIKNRQGMIKLMQKRDVFALGCTFYETLTQKDPFKTRLDRHCDLSTYSSEVLKPTGAPPEIRFLIEKMLHADYKKRPSAKQALKFLDTFIQKKYPNVYQQIKTDQREFVHS